MSSKNFYVVKKGRKPGIYQTWEECKVQVHEFPSPIYRKFTTEDEAKAFLASSQSSNPSTKSTGKSSNSSTSSPLKLSLPPIESNSFDINHDYQPDKWSTLNNEFYIFTDGSCRNLPNGLSKAGIAVFFSLSTPNIKEILTDVTNNQCELMAILYTFKVIIKYFNYLVHFQKPINIVSDSEYSIKSVSLWIKTWKTNDWKTKNGEEVKNKDIITSIDNAMSRIELLNQTASHPVKIKFLHFNSHQPISSLASMDSTDKFLWKGNYIADQLAQDKI
jgi:ribonuclease HI